MNKSAGSKKLNRTLGLSSLIFYGVGVIIGAGVYSIIGAAAEAAGSGLWLSFVLAALVALLSALSYAELATSFPRAGAEYIYLGKALPKLPSASFIVGILVVITGATTCATVSLAFAGYFETLIGWPIPIVAGALLILCALINIIGIRESSWVTIGCTIIEIVGLILIIGFGVTAPTFGEALLQPLHLGVLSGAGLIFFVYTGFEGLANLSEESKKPETHLPLALLLSLGITTILYILVGLSVLALSSPEALGASSSPLTTALAQRSPSFASALSWIALFSTANTALIVMLVGSRLLYGMGVGGDLPKAFTKTLPSRKSPWVATVVVLLAALSLIPLGKVAVAGSLSSLITLTAFISVNLALIILRFKSPQLKRPFRVPLSIKKFPILPALAIPACIFMASRFEWIVYAAGAGAFALSATAYIVLKQLKLKK